MREEPEDIPAPSPHRRRRQEWPSAPPPPTRSQDGVPAGDPRSIHCLRRAVPREASPATEGRNARTSGPRGARRGPTAGPPFPAAL
eukprot:3176023-Alexandrium_andersonii.AAC.1